MALDDRFGFWNPQVPTSPTWRPAADVYRTGWGWIVKVELAGVRPADVEVALAGSQVRITGRRRDWLIREDWEDCTQYSMELSYNRFARAIQLPCSLNRARLEVEFRDGILLVRVHSAEDSRG